MKKRDYSSITLGVMCAMLTTATVIQLNTIYNANQIVGSTYSENELRNEVLKWQEKYENIYNDIEKAEIELAKSRELASKDNIETEEAENTIKKLNMTNGLTDVKGQGLIITLNDYPNALNMIDTDSYVVHDFILLKLVNELKGAGAEAISINEERIVNSTVISCEGTTIMINGKRVAAPFEVKAIGQVDLMYGSLTFQNAEKVIYKYKDYLQIFVKKAKVIEIPKFNGVFKFDYLKSI